MIALLSSEAPVINGNFKVGALYKTNLDMTCFVERPSGAYSGRGLRPGTLMMYLGQMPPESISGHVFMLCEEENPWAIIRYYMIDEMVHLKGKWFTEVV